ncbi:MAG: hypothetical protein IKB34_09190 [Clostridia bacterium]|nr:hypothetical protein [Clostridia bacterium]
MKLNDRLKEYNEMNRKAKLAGGPEKYLAGIAEEACEPLLEELNELKAREGKLIVALFGVSCVTGVIIVGIVACEVKKRLINRKLRKTTEKNECGANNVEA